jgi:hypothetical protein
VLTEKKEEIVRQLRVIRWSVANCLSKLAHRLRHGESSYDQGYGSADPHNELRDCRGLLDLKPGESLLFAIETLKAKADEE